MSTILEYEMMLNIELAKNKELQEENDRLREALEKIATYRQFPSEKIALNALHPNKDIIDE